MPDVFKPTEKKTASQPKILVSAAPTKAHLLSSFCSNPTNVSFHNQDQGESILLLVRRHFATNIPWILFVGFLLLVPFLFPVILSSFQTTVTIPDNYIFIGLLLYYLVVFSYGFVSFITWFYNVGLITGKRVVDIDFSDLLFTDVSMTTTDHIEDVRYSQGGFFPSFFNYGDVFIQTDAQHENFDFHAVPQPAVVTNFIEDLISSGGPDH